MPTEFELPEDVTPEEVAAALFGRPVRRAGRKMVKLEIAEPDENDPDWTPLRRVEDGEGDDGDVDGEAEDGR